MLVQSGSGQHDRRHGRRRGNVISGNGNSAYSNGYGIQPRARRMNVVAGNMIGTDATGTQALGNRPGRCRDRWHSRSGATDNTIGGTTAVAGNLITDNGGPGRRWWRHDRQRLCVGNQITANRIFGNTGQAIDLGDDGVTDNGTVAAPGPEQPPELPDHRHRPPTARLEGWLGGSSPDTTFRIDFFASAGYGPGGSGEARGLPGLAGGDDRRERAGDVSPSPSRRRPGCRSSRPRPPTPRATPRKSRPFVQATLQAPSSSVRAVPNQALAFDDQAGRRNRDRGSRCRAARPGLEPDALGLRRDADPVEHRRPDRLGRWDRIAVVQRSAVGAERGARGPDLHAARGLARLCHRLPRCPVRRHACHSRRNS